MFRCFLKAECLPQICWEHLCVGAHVKNTTQNHFVKKCHNSARKTFCQVTPQERVICCVKRRWPQRNAREKEGDCPKEPDENLRWCMARAAELRRRLAVAAAVHSFVLLLCCLSGDQYWQLRNDVFHTCVLVSKSERYTSEEIHITLLGINKVVWYRTFWIAGRKTWIDQF